jgi:hypothetical protein
MRRGALLRVCPDGDGRREPLRYAQGQQVEEYAYARSHQPRRMVDGVDRKWRSCKSLQHPYQAPRGEIFRDLDQLKPGDQVILYTTQQQYVYVITGSQIVPPTQVEVMNPTSDATVTLITCYPYLVDTKRIVVFAKLQNP